MDALSSGSWSSIEAADLQGLLNSTFDSAATASTGADIDASLSAIDDFLALVADSANVSFSAGAAAGAGGQGVLKSRTETEAVQHTAQREKTRATRMQPPAVALTGDDNTMPLRKFAQSVHAAGMPAVASSHPAQGLATVKAAQKMPVIGGAQTTSAASTNDTIGTLYPDAASTPPLSPTSATTRSLADFAVSTPSSPAAGHGPTHEAAPPTAGTDPTMQRSPPSTGQTDPQHALTTLREMGSSLPPPHPPAQHTPVASEHGHSTHHYDSTLDRSSSSPATPLLPSAPAQALHFVSPPPHPPRTLASGRPSTSRSGVKRRVARKGPCKAAAKSSSPAAQVQKKAVSPMKHAPPARKARGASKREPKARSTSQKMQRSAPPAPQDAARGWLERVLPVSSAGPSSSGSPPLPSAEQGAIGPRQQHYVIHPGEDTIVLDIRGRQAADGSTHWPHVAVERFSGTSPEQQPDQQQEQKSTTRGRSGAASSPMQIAHHHSSNLPGEQTPPPVAAAAPPQPSPALLRAQAALAEVAQAENELEQNMAALGQALQAESSLDHSPRSIQEKLEPPTTPPLPPGTSTSPHPALPSTGTASGWDADTAEQRLIALDGRMAGLAHRLQSVAAGFGVVPPPNIDNHMPPLAVLLHTIQAKCEAERDGALARSQTAHERVRGLVARADASQAQLVARAAEAQAVLYADAAAKCCVSAAVLRGGGIGGGALLPSSHGSRQVGAAVKPEHASRKKRPVSSRRRSGSKPRRVRAVTPLQHPGWRL